MYFKTNSTEKNKIQQGDAFNIIHGKEPNSQVLDVDEELAIQRFSERLELMGVTN